MERPLAANDGPPADAGHPVETGEGRDPTNAAFIDEFEEREGRYRAKYDSARATPCEAVVTVVSNLTGVDPLELDPIYESIDADCVDALFTPDSSSASRLTFQYSGYEITVGTDDVVEVVTE